jgi:hypothetical protein
MSHRAGSELMLTNQIRLNSTAQPTNAPKPDASNPNAPKLDESNAAKPKPPEPKAIPRKPRKPPTQEWEKAKRKRARKGSKDWRRQRLEWRDTDKERRHYQQRWMKFSKQPGKKPLPVFTQRSHCISLPDLPLNQILSLTDR